MHYAVTGNLDPTRLTTIINGRGKSNDGEAYPLTVYTINHGDRLRWRMIHPGAEYTYYVQVDNHELYIVASDGHDMSPREAHHIQIQPGETMDFEMDADQTTGNYWMRLRTIKDISDGVIREGLAIVRYNGAPEEEPNTTSHDCTTDSPCNVFNCPFAGFADSENKHCITFNDATSTLVNSELEKKYGISDPDYEEYFYKFVAPDQGMNGKGFVEPLVPLYQPHDDAIVPCDEADCDSICTCTHMETLPFNRTMQMVFYNLAVTPSFAHHPLHIHGHSFAILKVGFPEYNHDTGLWTKANEDIECLETE